VITMPERQIDADKAKAMQEYREKWVECIENLISIVQLENRLTSAHNVGT